MKQIGQKLNKVIVIATLICLFPTWCFSACRYRLNTYSVDLDGTSEYLYITDGNQTGLDTYTFTWEGWVYLDSLADKKNATLFSKVTSGGTVIYEFQIYNHLGIYLFNDGYNLVFLPIKDIGNWIHIAVTLDNNQTLKYFLNGREFFSHTGGIIYATTDGDYYIGSTGGTSNFLNGKMDDVRFWNYARTDEQLINYKNVPIDIESGLMGSWHFNNDSYIDYSNNENDLTAGGTPSANYLTGYDDKSMDFESSSSQYAYVETYILYGEALWDVLDITGDFTFEGWFNFESLPAEGDSMFFLSKGENGVSHSYEWGLENDSGTYKLFTTLHFTSSSAYIIEKEFTPSTATWNHLAVTYDSSEHSLQYYVNGWKYGNPLDTVITSIYDDVTDFYIGASEGISGEYGFFDGKIDDVKIWDKVKTQEEIDGQKAREIIGNEDNLLAYWKFNRNHYDDSTNYGSDVEYNNDLVLVNSPQYSDTVPFIQCRDQLIIF